MEVVVAKSKCCLATCLKGLRKNTGALNQDSWCPGLDSNPVLQLLCQWGVGLLWQIESIG
jgi:hypothetical protein